MKTYWGREKQGEKDIMSSWQVEEQDYIVKKKIRILLYIVAAVTESSEWEMGSTLVWANRVWVMTISTRLWVTRATWHYTEKKKLDKNNLFLKQAENSELNKQKIKSIIVKLTTKIWSNSNGWVNMSFPHPLVQRSSDV